MPLSERRKMVKEEVTNVGKANGTAVELFDPKLYHVLTTVAELELDGVHFKYRNILSKNNLLRWEDFIICDEIDDIRNLKYTDEQGEVISFLKREKNRVTKLWNRTLSPM